MIGTASHCIKEADEATEPLGVDSGVAETVRYEYVERLNREERDLVETRQKTYWKYHITVLLVLQIVLAALAAPGRFTARSVV